MNCGSHTAQSSISEDFLDPESEPANGDADDSDDDVDSEIFNGGQEEVEHLSTSRLKRSIRNIRSNKEAIKGSLRKAKETTKDKMFGRHKRNELAEKQKEKEPSRKKQSGDVEIESGVEMVEDMVIPAGSAADNSHHARSGSGGGSLVSYFYRSAITRSITGQGDYTSTTSL